MMEQNPEKDFWSQVYLAGLNQSKSHKIATKTADLALTELTSRFDTKMPIKIPIVGYKNNLETEVNNED